MGAMLAATERAKGAQGTGSNQHVKKVVVCESGTPPPPTLAALGLTRKESAAAQQLAAVPQKDFEEIRTGEKSRESF